MANSLQMTQQTGEMSEGLFSWKVERFMENKKERKSPVFKFGRHNCFLRFSNTSWKYFTDLVDCSISNTHPVSSNFQMELHIDELLGLDIFSNITFYKLCFITHEGREWGFKSGFIRREESSFHMSAHRCGGGSGDEMRAKLLPEDTLTIRLTWYELRNRIGPMKDERETQTPPDLIPEKEPTKLLLRLSEDFGRFYESKADTDCVLRVGDVQIPAHRAVLSARSEVFAAMFRHDTSEKHSGIVNIPDVDPAVLGDVLYYIYSGQIRGMSADTAAPMYVVADKYAMIELRDTCMELLKGNLTVENVCDAALLAHTHGEDELEKKVVQFMEERLEEVEESDKWKQFLDNRPKLANKLLRCVVVACKDKMRMLLS